MYVPPHKLTSRDATPEDNKKIIGMGALMYLLALTPPPQHPKALAIAHSQVDDKDPIRFFVTNDGDVIINPVITRHSSMKYTQEEGCTTFVKQVPWTKVMRWQKIEVDYYVIEDNDTMEWVKKHEACSGKRAHMFQHEIDHMDGKYVYDINWNEVAKFNAKT